MNSFSLFHVQICLERKSVFKWRISHVGNTQKLKGSFSIWICCYPWTEYKLNLSWYEPALVYSWEPSYRKINRVFKILLPPRIMSRSQVSRHGVSGALEALWSQLYLVKHPVPNLHKTLCVADCMLSVT